VKYEAAGTAVFQIVEKPERVVETYLSIEGLAEYLGVAEKTVRKWVLNNDIPYHKIMKLVRFRLSEIEQWVETSGKFPQVNKDEVSENELFEEGETVEETDCGEDKTDIGNAETGGEA
jgi:excisionase family DNA binding protein